MAPLDDKVRELVVAVERDFLDAGARGMPYVAALMLAIGAFELWTDRLSFWGGLEVLVVLAMAVGMARRWSHRTRSLTLTLGLVLLSTCALMHFGPLLGTGLLFVATALCATFFFGRRGAVATLAMLGAALVVAALGLVPPGAFQPSLDAAAWARIAIGTVIVLGYATFLFYRLQQVNRQALDREVRALREQEAGAAERVRLLRAAEASERLTSLGRMASGVAHDFNNALQVIQMGVAVLRSQGPDAQSEALLSDIETASRNASATVRELLTFSRQAPQPVGRCAPAALLTRLRPLLERLIPKQSRLELEGTFDGEVEVAEAELEQVLLSLVFNARDAMPEGGTVRVTYGTGDDGAFWLEVADDGEGMDEETQERIFEPFFSTRGAGGTGLGLATVWGIVTRASGSIRVASEPGEGSAFTVRLPAAAPGSDPASGSG